MEGETDASLYKAIVAVAPVMDLEKLKQEAANYTDERIVDDFIGSGPHVVDGSPDRHPERIQVPVLLAHGDMDENVNFEQSQRMAAALRDNGKNVDFLPYKGLDHQLDDLTARADLLTHMGELLDRTIGH